MSREEKFKTIIKNIDIEPSFSKNFDKPSFNTYRAPKKDWISSKFSKNKYASYKPFQFVDGEGIRCSIYLSGCLFACKECFNESIQNFRAGEEYNQTVEDTIINDLSKSYVQGLTILGGEPFLNTNVAIKLATRVRKEFGRNKDIWVYSGFTYEQIINSTDDKKKLLSLCDVLVDGPFILALKDLNLRFRGSSNQRIIDLKKSTNRVVLYME